MPVRRDMGFSPLVFESKTGKMTCTYTNQYRDESQ